MKEINGYTLSRNWFDWAFENPEKISPNHSAIYFFAIEHCNRLGWKEKFGFPTQMAMDALGIKNHSTYIKYFNDLVEWKFINLIEKSKNQYSANIISLISAVPKNNKALSRAYGRATGKAHNEQPSEQTTSNPKSTESIYKPSNQVTREPRNEVTENSLPPDEWILKGVNIPEPLQLESFRDSFERYEKHLASKYREEVSPQQFELQLKKLLELQAEGNDPVEVIDQTVTNGHKAFYALREEYKIKQNNHGNNGKQSRIDRDIEFINELSGY